MGIDISTWRKIIGSFTHHADRSIRDRSNPAKGRTDISPSLHITTEQRYPLSFFFLLFILFLCLFNILFMVHLYGTSLGTPLPITYQTTTYFDQSFVFIGHQLTPRVQSPSDVLHSTSVTLIPQQLLLRAMDINPNPGPTNHWNQDFSSLPSTAKQRFNEYKRIANKITRHEFHLETYQYYLEAKLIPKGLQPGLQPAIKPVSKNFLKQWNENINHLAFLQLHLLEDECKKKLAIFKKTKAHLGNHLKELCDHNTFYSLINFTTNVVSKLQSKLRAKHLTKIRRDLNVTTMHYPTDFPFYIQVGDTIDSLSLRQQDHARSNQSHARQPEDPPNAHPSTNHSSVENNSTADTAPQNRRITRRLRKSKSYTKRKGPIRLDTSTVINLSNVQLTEDETLLLSRGLTFCPTPRHIDWTQVKADINDFSRRLRLKEYFFDPQNNRDFNPNPFRLKSTWCPPPNREPVLDIYIDSVERDIMSAKPTRIRDNLTKRERQALKKTTSTNRYPYQTRG